MAISDKLTYLNTTKGKIKDSINLTGANIGSNDTFRSYAVKLRDGLLDIINNGTATLYNNFPKVSGTGSNISLSNTLEAPMFMNKFDGDTLQQQIIPSEYTQVDYIQNNHNTEYIDTRIIGKKNIKIYMDLNMIRIPPRNNPMTGSYGNEQRCYLGIISSSGVLGYSYGTTSWSTTSISANQRNVIEIDFTQSSQSMKLNGTSILTTTNSLNMNTNKNIHLFGYNQNGAFDTRYDIYYKLYRYKIYDENTLVRDFVPCYRNSDNEVGMYDLIENRFYENAGTGAFTYGAVVPTPDSPLEIQSVEGIQTITIGDGTNSDSYTIDLGSIKLYNGDYITGTLDNWSIVRNNGSVVLNGSENWTLGTNRTNTMSFNTNLDNSYASGSDSANGYTSYFIGNTRGSDIDKNCFWFNPSGAFRIRIEKVNLNETSVDGFKNWLSTHNTEVVYKLATPTTTPITDTTLITQLNALYNAKSYDGQTNITVSGNLPMILEVSALKDEI